MPVSVCELDAPTAHALPVFGCVRSDPPVATKLRLPVNRAKRVMGVCCASATSGASAHAKTAHHGSSRFIAT
jgi:hypothetical protein